MAIEFVEEAVYYLLANTGAITALVGTYEGGPCIFPVTMPQAAVKPAIEYVETSEEVESAMGSDPGNCTSHVDVRCLTATFTTATALALSKAVRAAMKRWRGTYGSIVIEDCFLENRYGEYDFDIDAYQIVMTFKVHWR